MKTLYLVQAEKPFEVGWSYLRFSVASNDLVISICFEWESNFYSKYEATLSPCGDRFKNVFIKILFGKFSFSYCIILYRQATVPSDLT